MFVLKSGTFNTGDKYAYLHSNIERILFTPLGSIIGNLGSGSRIPDFLNEPLDTELAVDILKEVKRLVIYHFGKVLYLNSLSIEIINSDDSTKPQRGILINLEMELKKNKETIQMEFIKIKEI